MLTEERRQVILERLQTQGKVVAAELSSSLEVSPDTVRRDLRDLAEAGLLRRVHGGALPAALGARSYAVRREQAPAAKAAIARATGRLLRDGQVIVLDAGTTTLEVARHLPPELEATIITNSPPIAVELAEHPRVKVSVVGGTLEKDSHALVGASAVAAFSSVRADVLVLGVCSLHPEVGITVLDLEEVYVKRAMVAYAAEVGRSPRASSARAAPYVVAPLDELTYLVTEESIPAEQLADYRALGIEVVRA